MILHNHELSVGDVIVCIMSKIIYPFNISNGKLAVITVILQISNGMFSKIANGKCFKIDNF